MKRVLLVASLFVSALASVPVGAAVEFTKIVDTNTPAPGAAGSFTGFGASGLGPGAIIPASISGQYVAFEAASGPSNSMGIYVSNGTGLTRVADVSTADPSGGKFATFGGLSQDGPITTFLGRNAATTGIYQFANGIVSRIADQNSPSLAHNHGTIAFPLLSASGFGGRVAFSADVSPPNTLDTGMGIYSDLSGQVTPIVNQATPVPQQPGQAFLDFGKPTFRDGKIAFGAQFSPNDITKLQNGIYLADSTTGTVTRIADQTVPRPGGAAWDGFSTFVGFDGKNVSFLETPNQGGSQIGYGVYTTIGASADEPLRVVADYSTLVPGTSMPFGYFSAATSLEGKMIAFLGAPNYPGLSNTTLYTWDDGEIEQILAPGDQLDGKTIDTISMGTEALNGGRLAVTINFSDKSQGIYVIDLPEPFALASLVPVAAILVRRRR